MKETYTPPSPETKALWDRQREERAAEFALPGVLHHFGKTIVIFAHPKKILPMQCEDRLMALGDAERLARLSADRPYCVAFIPRQSGAVGERVERLSPYLLPITWKEIDQVRGLLRCRKSLRPARAADVAFAIGRHDVEELVPGTTRKRLMRLLSGECTCCGAKTYPDLTSLSPDLTSLNPDQASGD